MKLTPWFNCKTNPMRAGVYERELNDGHKFKRFQHWNGDFWCAYATSPKGAMENRSYESGFQGGRWRGLAEQPK